MVTAWCADSYSRMAWRYGTLIVCSWLGSWVSSSYSGSLASKLEILIGASVPDDGFADFMPGTWCDFVSHEKISSLKSSRLKSLAIVLPLVLISQSVVMA